MIPTMPKELTIQFENMIYLPIVLTVLYKDQDLMKSMPFKFKRVYTDLVDQTIKDVEKELKLTKIYMIKHSFKMLKGSKGDNFTEYIFYYNGYEDHRKYQHNQMKIRTEQFISTYLTQSFNHDSLKI